MEKISSGEEYDTYKVTYTDGTTDTFDIKKDSVSIAVEKEEILRRYALARSATAASRELTYESYAELANESVIGYF